MGEIERIREELYADADILKKISEFTRSREASDKIFDLVDEIDCVESTSDLEKCYSSIYECILFISNQFSKKNMDLISHPCIKFSEDLLDILLEKYICRAKRENSYSEEKEMPF